MKVLLVGDVVGGVRTFIRELARELSTREVDVHLALLGPAPAAAGLDEHAASCQVRDLRLEWMESPWADVEATSEWIEQLCDLHRPDVVHMNTFAAVRPPSVPVLLTVHSCVLTWWRAVHGACAPASWGRYRQLAEAALERAELVTTPTHALLKSLNAVYGRVGAARVVANGRSLDGVVWNQSGRDALVLSVGRLWDHAKNARLLAQAAAAIDGRVALIGPGAVAGVQCLGELAEKEVLHWMSRAAVFAEPARYEPFGLAALEAALCGCALVLGDIPSLREVWGSAATFVSPEDPDELAHEVNLLLRDPARRARAARAAHDVALRYTPAAMGEAYLGAYLELARAAVAA